MFRMLFYGFITLLLAVIAVYSILIIMTLFSILYTVFYPFCLIYEVNTYDGKNGKNEMKFLISYNKLIEYIKEISSAFGSPIADFLMYNGYCKSVGFVEGNYCLYKGKLLKIEKIRKEDFPNAELEKYEEETDKFYLIIDMLNDDAEPIICPKKLKIARILYGH